MCMCTHNSYTGHTKTEKESMYTICIWQRVSKNAMISHQCVIVTHTNYTWICICFYIPNKYFKIQLSAYRPAEKLIFHWCRSIWQPVIVENQTPWKFSLTFVFCFSENRTLISWKLDKRGTKTWAYIRRAALRRWRVTECYLYL